MHDVATCTDLFRGVLLLKEGLTHSAHCWRLGEWVREGGREGGRDRGEVRERGNGVVN